MRRLLGTLALVTCAVLGTGTAALAQTPRCDSYSGACVGGVKETRKPDVLPTRDNSGLPVTGGQVVGMLVFGSGAVAGGSVLVAAGRKRRTAS